MTRLSVLERVALLAVAAFLVVLGFEIGGGDGWWRWPVSVVLVLAGAAVAASVVLVTARQSPDRPEDGNGDRDDA